MHEEGLLMPKVETQNIPSELMGSYLMALQIETDTPLLSGSAPFTGYVKNGILLSFLLRA